MTKRNSAIVLVLFVFGMLAMAMQLVDRTIAKSYEYTLTTSGSVATVTLTYPSYDFKCAVGAPNGTATDSLDLQINGGTKIRLYQGEGFGENTYEVATYSVTAVSGTPAIRCTAFELK